MIGGLWRFRIRHSWHFLYPEIPWTNNIWLVQCLWFGLTANIFYLKTTYWPIVICSIMNRWLVTIFSFSEKKQLFQTIIWNTCNINYDFCLTNLVNKFFSICFTIFKRLWLGMKIYVSRWQSATFFSPPFPSPKDFYRIG